MKATTVFNCFLVSLLPGLSIAAIDPASLIKVSKENNPRCVEYYQYKEELYCSLTALSKDKLDINPMTDERQKINFDDRPWRFAWGKKTDQITTIEYVPHDEDINNWNELITSQFIPGIQDKITPLEFEKYFVDNLQKTGLNSKSYVISTTPTEVIFEFRVTSPENLKQNEIQKITKGSDGFYILHYAIKKADMGDTNRNKWLVKLNKSSISK